MPPRNVAAIDRDIRRLSVLLPYLNFLSWGAWGTALALAAGLWFDPAQFPATPFNVGVLLFVAGAVVYVDLQLRRSRRLIRLLQEQRTALAAPFTRPPAGR